MNDIPDQSDAENASSENLLSIDYRWLRIIFYVGVIIWVSLLMVHTQEWSFSDWLFPRLAGIFVVIFLLFEIIREVFPGYIESLSPETDNPSESFGANISNNTRSKAEQEKYQILMVLWVILLPILLYYLGFLLTLPLYLLAFFAFFLSNRLRAIGLTLLMSIFIYTLFVQLLGISLPPGELEIIQQIY